MTIEPAISLLIPPKSFTIIYLRVDPVEFLQRFRQISVKKKLRRAQTDNGSAHHTFFLPIHKGNRRVLDSKAKFTLIFRYFQSRKRLINKTTKRDQVWDTTSQLLSLSLDCPLKRPINNNTYIQPYGVGYQLLNTSLMHEKFEAANP